MFDLAAQMNLDLNPKYSRNFVRGKIPISLPKLAQKIDYLSFKF